MDTGMTVEAKLGRNVFKLDKNSHIAIRHDVCQTNCVTHYCLFVCPANVYSWSDERKQVHAEFEGCLECGTCVIACDQDALQWRYPRAGYGVQYRFG
jgi:ferredoxin like protein